MRLQTVFLVIFLGLFTAFFVMFGLDVSGGKPFEGWGTDFEQATAEAREKDRPLLVYFTDDSDPYREKIGRTIFSDPSVRDFTAETLEMAIVDVSPEKNEDARGFAEQLLIEGTPAIILLDPRGKEIARMAGYHGTSPDGFLVWLEKALASTSPGDSGS